MINTRKKRKDIYEKAFIYIFSFLFVFALLLQNSLLVKADDELDVGTINYDIVFVVDDSGSMVTTDPDKITFQVMKCFFDSRPEVGDSLGIVTYSLEEVDSYNLREVRNDMDKDEIKGFIDSRVLRNGKYTNIGAGLEGAIEQLNEFGIPGHKKAIILLTDGENDVKGSDITAEDAEQQLSTALDECVSGGYPVYSIGINPKSDTYTDCINNIAEQTGAKSYFPKDVDELGENINDILNILGASGQDDNGGDGKDGLNGNKSIGTEPQSFPHTYKKNVFEADISIKHQGELTFSLTKPDGSVAAEGDDYKVISDEGYTVIKVFQPEAGEWILDISSSVEEDVNFNTVIYYFNLEIKFDESLAKEVNAGEESEIKAHLSYLEDGTIIENLSDYTDIKAALVIDGTEKEDMSISGSDMVIQYTFDEAGEYALGVKLEIRGYVIETTDDNRFMMSVNGDAPVVEDDSDKEENEDTTKDIGDDESKDADADTDSSKSKINLLPIILIIAAIIVVIIVVIVISRAKKKPKLYGYIIIQNGDFRNTHQITCGLHEKSLLSIVGGEIEALSNIIVRATISGIEIVNNAQMVQFFATNSGAMPSGNSIILNDDQSVNILIMDDQGRQNSIIVKYSRNEPMG